LNTAVAGGSFRSDLYYRLNVFPINLPPLRERRPDIALLTHYFIHKYAARIGKPIENITEQAMSRLVEYRWPGNIRELENIIERAVIVASGTIIDSESIMLGGRVETNPSLNTAVSETRTNGAAEGTLTASENERRHILRILEQTRWVIEGERGAAKVLGLHPNTLRSSMKQLGLKRTNDIS
jgi:transcriptional regulator with GAF, ATPase, and Fis domain